MTILRSMNEVAQMARDKGQICYLYKSSAGYFASFQYWGDWLFRAYPGGRKILSTEGRKLVERETGRRLI